MGLAARRLLESIPKRPRGFVPPRRPVAELPGDVEPAQSLLPVPGSLSRLQRPSPGNVGLVPPPRYRRAHDVVWCLLPCLNCSVRGTMYFRVGGGNWKCHHCKLIFKDSDVTGEFVAIRAALEDAKGAVRVALDRVGSDDRVDAAQRLRFAEGCCRRARFLVERYTGPPGQPGDPEARR